MQDSPSRSFNLSLIALATFNFLPHLEEHLMITLLIAGTCIIWRLLYEYQKVRLPSFLIKLFLISITWILIWNTHKTFKGVEPATALLVSAIALKLIDSVSYRDAMVILFLNFLLLMAGFLVSQTMTMTLIGVSTLLLVTGLLFQLHKGKNLQFDLKSFLKTSLKLTLQTTPLLILLFFVFPRFSTGFFSLSSKPVGQSGFSPDLEPGKIAEIIKTDEVAFRVRFEGKTPNPMNRYWKGLILDRNYGMKWEKSLKSSTRKNKRVAELGGSLEQVITLEPTFGSYLFTLDQPLWIEFSDPRKDRDTYVNFDGTFFLKKDNLQHKLYRAFSQNSEKTHLPPSIRKKYLQTNKETDPRFFQLVEKIKQNTEDGKSIADNMMTYFSSNYSYTLKPGELKTNKVSEFLFEKKKGFCEHFAASFAAVMRSAGVPSRVVIGFQGAAKNDLDDYFIVRSKDAHAWVEIYSDREGKWLRYDPTEVTANLRLELGGEIYHSLDEEQLRSGMNREQALKTFEGSWSGGLVRKALFTFDMVSARWNNFLLNYNQSGQKNYLSQLGLKNISTKNLTMATLLILMVYFLWIRWKDRKKRTFKKPEKIIFNELIKWCSEKGLSKKMHEGPNDFLLNCEKTFHKLDSDFQKFREIYIPLTYGLPQNNSKEQVNTLKALVKRIKQSEKKHQSVFDASFKN